MCNSSNGVIELRRLFTGGVAREDGKLASRESICESIRDIVEAEDNNYPLSDTQLTNKLTHSGVKIARRTVTQYRERAGISQAKLSNATAPEGARGKRSLVHLLYDFFSFMISSRR